MLALNKTLMLLNRHHNGIKIVAIADEGIVCILAQQLLLFLELILEVEDKLAHDLEVAGVNHLNRANRGRSSLAKVKLTLAIRPGQFAFLFAANAVIDVACQRAIEAGANLVHVGISLVTDDHVNVCAVACDGTCVLVEVIV